MQKWENEKVKELFEGLGSERRGLEFKPGFIWNRDKSTQYPREKVTRAVLGLTNTPNGGIVILGVNEDEQKRPTFSGLDNDEQFESFKNEELIKGEIENFSTVSLDFEISWGEFEDNKFIFFVVSEFAEHPAICRKDGEKHDNGKFVLCQYDIYSRAKKGRPATIKATDVEIQEIMRMAANKERLILEQFGYKKETVNTDEFYKKQIADLMS